MLKGIETWKDIPGFEGLYQVSSLGRVKSFPRNGAQVKTPHILKPSTSSGYALYTLYRNDKKIYRKGHRLVAEAFLPNPENKREVNHIDGDKTNNRADNLEWATTSENQAHCYWVLKNSGGFLPKPVQQFSLAGKFIREWPAQHVAAKSLNICDGDISRCCNGIRHTAGGFIWTYNNATEGD